MNPTKQAVADTLRRLALSELPDTHPRKLAREAVMEFRSNAQREGLPVVNSRDVHGAPLLDRDGVIEKSLPSRPSIESQQNRIKRLHFWLVVVTVGTTLLMMLVYGARLVWRSAGGE